MTSPVFRILSVDARAGRRRLKSERMWAAYSALTVEWEKLVLSTARGERGAARRLKRCEAHRSAVWRWLCAESTGRTRGRC